MSRRLSSRKRVAEPSRRSTAGVLRYTLLDRKELAFRDGSSFARVASGVLKDTLGVVPRGSASLENLGGLTKVLRPSGEPVCRKCADAGVPISWTYVPDGKSCWNLCDWSPCRSR